MKEAIHKRPHAIQFHLYEMSRTGKSRETESRLEFARGWRVWKGSGKFGVGVIAKGLGFLW